MSATNRGGIRNPADFYPTPRTAIISLLDCLDTESDIFRSIVFGEPCLGHQDIPNAIYSHCGYRHKWMWAELNRGRDYLIDGLSGEVDAIITNPPFSLAQEFISRSLNEAPFVAYLLRLNFLGSQKRHEWWQGKEPSHLYTLSKRPSFTGKGTDATEYAWFVWDKLGLCKHPAGVYVI